MFDSCNSKSVVDADVDDTVVSASLETSITSKMRFDSWLVRRFALKLKIAIKMTSELDYPSITYH